MLENVMVRIVSKKLSRAERHNAVTPLLCAFH